MTQFSRYLDFVQGVTVLTIGSAILYCIYHVPWNISVNWCAWVAVNAVLLLLLPLAVIICFFDEGPVAFGFTIGNTRAAGRWVLAGVLLMLPLLLAAARRQDFQMHYPLYRPAADSAAQFLVLIATSGVYLFAWEYLFRGFLLSGMKRGFGHWAVLIQAIPFGLSHLNSPRPEMLGSFLAGIALGELAWRYGSFLPGFILHWTVYVVFNLLVILAT